jgi:hypothetical protein
MATALESFMAKQEIRGKATTTMDTLQPIPIDSDGTVDLSELVRVLFETMVNVVIDAQTGALIKGNLSTLFGFW